MGRLMFSLHGHHLIVTAVTKLPEATYFVSQWIMKEHGGFQKAAANVYGVRVVNAMIRHQGAKLV